MPPSNKHYKWAWIVYGSIHQKTGGYIYDRIVIDQLRAEGDEISLISLNPRPLSRRLSALRLAAHLGRLKPDAIVGDELCHRELCTAFSALGPSPPRIALVHHLGAWEKENPRPFSADPEKRTLLASHAIIATSSTTQRRLEQEFPISSVQVIEPGADRLPLRPRSRAENSKLILLSVGSLIPRKRQLELLRAFEKAAVPNAELVLAGDFHRDFIYFDRIRSALRASTYLQTHVQMRAQVSDPELSELFSKAEALVLASSLEGYGMVITEAIFAGLPILCTRAGAVENIVRHGSEAWVCDSPDELFLALKIFLNNAEMRARMRAAAQQRRETLPTWKSAGRAFRSALIAASEKYK